MPEQEHERTRQEADSRPAPLDGLLVADFSRVLAGPYCTMLLGDLGATVIKVESPAGDDTRNWLPPERDGVATYYLAINRNKRSVILDFNNPADLQLAHELAARADIFIENFKPGGLKRFALDYDAVRQLNPRVIYASISGFGTAQGASLPGYDLIVQAMSGLMSLTGDPDGPAYRSGISVFDVMAGLHTTIGILAALNHRNHSGEGQHVETSLYATAMSGMVNQTSAYVSGGVVPQRMGNAHPSLFPYEPLPTADQALIIAAGNNGQFSKLCEILGLPTLPHDPRFANTKDRTRNREALRPLLVERLRTRPAQEWFRLLSAAGVPCGPINSVDQGVAFAREIGLDPVVEVGTGDNALPMVRHPISFSLTPPRYKLPPPALGQDNEQIRAWLSQRKSTGADGLNTASPSSEEG
ncbi:MAG TPA: CoA transferase [Ktedonobacteraceae bacterium]|jgi:crotonobetainyl-CoA:carnitine CoA-transferase CaiB-like acyl-CoA transferase|nr:CoA transferase [Ktedonobacteraceae bacterium]